MSLETSSKDEIRVIIALGILAGVLAYFQLRSSGGFFAMSSPVRNIPSFSLILYNLYLELFVFGVYLLLLTIAMGIDALTETWFAQFVKDFADVSFFFGAVGLLPLAANIFLFLQEEESPATNPVFDSATYIGFLIVLIVLILLAFTGTKMRKGPSRKG